MKKLLLLLLVPVVAYIVLGLAMPEKIAEWGVNAERARSGLEHKTTVVDGETWHYLEGGPADAETVLMVHGFSADKDNWMRFAKTITPKYHVVAPDLPGFGESARHPDWNYDLPEQRKRLAAFVDALGIKRVHIVGNSMGGHLAALYTHAHPEQVISMALFNNAGIVSPTPSEFQELLAKGENPLIVKTEDDFYTKLEWAAHVQPFIPWPVKGVMARQAVEHGAFDEYIFKQYRSDRRAGLEQQLAEIKNPTLILWGRYDRLLHVSSIEVMRPVLPQAEIIIMEDTGHVPMIERPELTAKHYLGFIDKHD